MQVKVSIGKDILVDIDDPAVEKLDNFWRTHDPSSWADMPAGLADDAIKAIEQAVGLPFGNDSAPETIVGIYAMDGEAILEH